MATAKIDKEAVKTDLLDGMTPSELIEKYPCTRQYISLQKQSLVKAGRLPKSPAGRKPRQKGNGDGLRDLTKDQFDDISITMYKRALRTAELEQENYQLKNRIASLEHENKMLRQKDQKIVDGEREFELAKKRGEFPKLTEGLDCAPHLIVTEININ